MIKRLTDIVLYSSLFISIGSAALVARTYILSKSEINWIIIFFVFFSTLFTYNISKIIPLWSFWGSSKKESYAYNKRNLWNVKHKDKLLYVSIFSLASLFIFVINLNCNQFIFITHLGVISVLYSAPILLGKSLRSLPLLKILLIAYVWASMSILPLYNGLETINERLIAIFFDNFCFIFAITIPFDIRDFSRDKSQSVETIPSILGIKYAKMVAILVLIVSFFISHTFLENPFHQIINFIINFITAMLIFKAKEKYSEYYYLGLIDGLLILRLVTFI